MPPPARAILYGLPREGLFVFPNRKGHGPITDRGLRWREFAWLDGVRIHDRQNTWALHGATHGVGLTTVARLLGHSRCETTAMHAHLDEAALRDATAQAGGRHRSRHGIPG